MIDLHVHTSMSDGTYSPREVVRLAVQKGLCAIAITDHDTVAGVLPAYREGLVAGIEIVPGVEISTEWPGAIMHILGYFVDPAHVGLSKELGELRADRRQRIVKIVEKLRSCNVFISVEDISRKAVGGAPGRPHVAEVMMRQGYVETIQEAFDRYLRKGRPAYIEKRKLAPDRALKIIRQAGGLCVLAHPYSLNENNPKALEDILSQLMSYGLQGLEVYYPSHTPQQVELYLGLAKRLNLAVTGGTDFHGSAKPDIVLGPMPGHSQIPCSILAELKERHAIGTPGHPPVSQQTRNDTQREPQESQRDPGVQGYD
jgi:hypothetical protein